MTHFNKIEFGKRLKEARKQKEYSLEYVAKEIEKTPSTVSRYECGKIIPNAKILNKLCNILDIYYDDLYKENEEKIVNTKNSQNPFKVNKLYLYYLGYRTKNKIDKFKLVINLKEKNNYVEAKISYYKTKKIILIGHVLADSFIVTVRTENYKANYPRLETNQIILNISEGTNGLIRGVMMCTNGEYVPNIKKCIVSKKDFQFNEEIVNNLKLDNIEKKRILRNGIWQVNINNQ